MATITSPVDDLAALDVILDTDPETLSRWYQLVQPVEGAPFSRFANTFPGLTAKDVFLMSRNAATIAALQTFEHSEAIKVAHKDMSQLARQLQTEKDKSRMLQVKLDAALHAGTQKDVTISEQTMENLEHDNLIAEYADTIAGRDGELVKKGAEGSIASKVAADKDNLTTNSSAEGAIVSPTRKRAHVEGREAVLEIA
ncbi:hypothetical protein BU25DRAFT_495487 [Macroventuria anomochaeta]|uniref:Uncharacterized protein n=1 Tax=Macroventuria anomochaeta TaxID=301207 RepID=A0ACB6RLB2_9PLEO|nr:uncharacterized protein BU25DRAFT_495487 [Macroventuria anomochaeta]KAF2621759.1 hypothetical protein BU25DRAFT_495487 [Macroventuria anomochaeta]